MTKSTITREQVIALIAEHSYDSALVDALEHLLATMNSEPVAFTEKHEISNMHATGIYLRAWPADRARNAVEGYTIPLYLHAQPAPVVPQDVLEALQKVARIRLDMNDFDGDRRGIADYLCDAEEALIEVVNRRAAMLAAAPQSPGSEPATMPGKWIPVSEQKPDCWCLTCRPVVLNDMRFVVCPDCGNKRCPRANDHRNACTGSNEPGQEGGAYPDTPQEVKP
ncbi:Uncharacterised protein [Klebsiella pneumoniae]|nr:hypothetical protein [Klebsiella pneumoniae]CAB5622188.1 Uncharacterised protein [Klebsiella pneumoniae]CAC9105801.1 Uncharacterised protein [Klebsiella pneumoniae]